MKNTYTHFFSKILFVLACCVCAYNAGAQVTSKYYYVGYNSPEFIPLTGGTVVASDAKVGVDSLYSDINIGFDFYFNCTSYIKLGISSNGFIWLGSTAPSKTEYNPISSTAACDGIISAYGANLRDGHSSWSLSGASPNSIITYKTLGTAPYRVFVAEWRKISATSNTNNSTDLQVRLYETSNKVELILWDWPYLISGVTTYGQVGIRSASNTDFYNLKVNNGGGSWCSPTQGTANTDNCGIVTSFPCGYTSGSGLDAICFTYVPVACDGLWNIRGKVYRDTDEDCLTTSGEPAINNVKVKLYDAANNLVQQMYSFNNGDYYFNTGVGDYTVKVDNSAPYDVLCPAGNSYAVSLTALSPTADNLDFRMKCKTGFDGAVRYIAASGLIRPAKTLNVTVAAGDVSKYYGNTCSAAVIPATVTVELTGPVKYKGKQTGALTPTTVAGNTITWVIADLAAVNITQAFKIIVAIDTTAQINDHVCIKGTVALTGVTDVNSNNNTYTRCYTIRTSVDPNNKEVMPEGNVDHPYSDWLTYTIHFQNTGNAPALAIKVLDSLDSKIDVGTFEMVGYSHTPIVSIRENVVTFNFPYINLPDSSKGQAASQGFIEYRVKAREDIEPNTTVQNAASIYFDFNAPVKTNTTSTTFCSPVITDVTAMVCEGESFNFNGTGYNVSGDYNSVPAYTYKGCDSMAVLHLAVTDIGATIQLTGNTIEATGNGTIQWKNCGTGDIIDGATSSTFASPEHGTYAAIFTNGNCSVTTECVSYIGTGTNAAGEPGEAVTVYPNPASDNINVVLLNGSLAGTMVFITDVTGRVVATHVLNNKQTTIDISALANGVYTMRTGITGSALKTKIVKQ